MNHGSNRLSPGESGELANGLTNHEHQRQTHRRREPFVVHCTHQHSRPCSLALALLASTLNSQHSATPLERQGK
ncbi:hypothetical protein JOQ06_016629 [Pogonophryne albipinna]|uniref:Uncharacterized protein n=1 Tax=Pogonophryne albipinna TaxID=1090488 RepID=A0AAD6B1X9_9TELE|nr:hypothetical protein JOQ06_016629 [Pogonophryne albipinna]